MKLSQQVISLEQAKRLKELGVSQDSYFSWCGDEELRLLDCGSDGMKYGNHVFIDNTRPLNNQQADDREDVHMYNPFAAAFTVAELGVMLGPDYTWSWPVLGEWICAECVVGDESCTSANEVRGATEAQSRAAQLISQLEFGMLTASEVNARLSQ